MHRPQLITWTTHTAETTTLLEATRLQKLYTYMCNIVTEFYLYSIVCIYLINSRLDVTHSVRHHFRTIQTLSILTNNEIPYFLSLSNRKLGTQQMVFGHPLWLEISQLIDFGHAQWSEISQLVDFNHWACSNYLLCS